MVPLMLVHRNCRLAFGVTRNVILIGRFAFKFPAVSEWRLFLLGLLANMQEVVFSGMNHPKLCPVVCHLPLGFLVVMRRARVLTDGEFDRESMLAWKTEENFEVPCELKSDSFGWLDGRIVAVDYGN